MHLHPTTYSPWENTLTANFTQCIVNTQLTIKEDEESVIISYCRWIILSVCGLQYKKIGRVCKLVFSEGGGNGRLSSHLRHGSGQLTIMTVKAVMGLGPLGTSPFSTLTLLGDREMCCPVCWSQAQSGTAVNQSTSCWCGMSTDIKVPEYKKQNTFLFRKLLHIWIQYSLQNTK